MASSLIRINEATTDQLQQLKGIGPKRATGIIEFRETLGPIRTTFDLAAATGINLKTAGSMADDIDWFVESPYGTIRFAPMLVAAVMCLMLIYIGFDSITAQPFVPPSSYYNLCLALILLGGLTATGDIAIAAVRQKTSETSWVFKMATVLCITGLASLPIFLLFEFPGLEYIQSTIGITLSFVFYCLLVCWFLWAPALLLRWLIEEKHAGILKKAVAGYDFSLCVWPVVIAIIATQYNSFLWIEEIFCAWMLVFLCVNSLELITSNSAFVVMLSNNDAGRLRFALSRQGTFKLTHNLKTAGYLAITSAMVLVLVLVYVLF